MLALQSCEQMLLTVGRGWQEEERYGTDATRENVGR